MAKSFNNSLLKKYGEQEAEKVRGEYEQQQLAVPIDALQPYYIPYFKHSLKELQEYYKNRRGYLLHIIHVFAYHKIKPGFNRGEKSRIDLVEKFIEEVKQAKNKNAVLTARDCIKQESLFSDEVMNDLIPHKESNFGRD
jgi:hypothetical protein